MGCGGVSDGRSRTHQANARQHNTVQARSQWRRWSSLVSRLERRWHQGRSSVGARCRVRRGRPGRLLDYFPATFGGRRQTRKGHGAWLVGGGNRRGEGCRSLGARQGRGGRGNRSRYGSGQRGKTAGDGGVWAFQDDQMSGACGRANGVRNRRIVAVWGGRSARWKGDVSTDIDTNSARLEFKEAC